MKIIISPYSQKLRNNQENPKNYPYWAELINLLHEDGHEILQVGVVGEEPLCGKTVFDYPLVMLKKKIMEYDTWISVDNFFPHFAQHVGKNGIVLWGKSDPKIFGYENNINLIKNRDNLRTHQYDIWENESYNPDVFVSPEQIKKSLMEGLNAGIFSVTADECAGV